jgi:hypothetical protein
MESKEGMKYEIQSVIQQMKKTPSDLNRVILDYHYGMYCVEHLKRDLNKYFNSSSYVDRSMSAFIVDDFTPPGFNTIFTDSYRDEEMSQYYDVYFQCFPHQQFMLARTPNWISVNIYDKMVIGVFDGRYLNVLVPPHKLISYLHRLGFPVMLQDNTEDSDLEMEEVE